MESIPANERVLNIEDIAVEIFVYCFPMILATSRGSNGKARRNSAREAYIRWLVECVQNSEE